MPGHAIGTRIINCQKDLFAGVAVCGETKTKMISYNARYYFGQFLTFHPFFIRKVAPVVVAALQ